MYHVFCLAAACWLPRLSVRQRRMNYIVSRKIIKTYWYLLLQRKKNHAQVHKAYGLAFAAADLGMGGFPKAGNPLVGHKHFDDSDYTVHRSKDWMGTVKMSSHRVVGTELVNEDNLKGYYLGDGATYFYVRGDEYLDVFPFWDWRKIPGVTSYEDQSPVPTVRERKSNNSTFLVGGLSDGRKITLEGRVFRPGCPGVYYVERTAHGWEKKLEAPFRMVTDAG